MKKIILIIAILIFAGKTFGQIKFFEGDFKQALNLAKSENKHLFIDFYTDWCSPCKYMSNNIFTNKNVGDYFNANFICCKLNAEDENMSDLVAKYKIKSFPSMLFTDNEGEEVRRIIGSVGADILINEGMIALGQKMDFEEMYSKYRKNKKDMELQQKILIDAPIFISTKRGYQFDKWKARIETMASRYTKNKGLDNMINPLDYSIIKLYLGQEERIFNHFVLNYQEYAKIVDKNDISEYIVGLYNSKIIDLCKKGDLDYKELLGRLDTDLKPIYSSIKFGDISSKKAVTLLADATYNLYKRNDKQFFENMNKYFFKLGNNLQLEDYTQAIESLFTVYDGELSQNSNVQVMVWMEKALAFKMSKELRVRLLIMMGQSLNSIGDVNKAKQALNQAYIISAEVKDNNIRIRLQDIIQRTINLL